MSTYGGFGTYGSFAQPVVSTPESTTYVYDYKPGFKQQITLALRSIFNATLEDARYRNIFVGWEYPLEQVRYPAIYVNYAEGPIRNLGVGNIELGIDEHNFPIEARHSQFEGTLNFNVLALNPEDRDNLSAVLLNVLQFGRTVPKLQPFFANAENGRFVQIQLNTETINPSGEQTVPTEWTPDELVFGNRYSVNLIGDFYSTTTTGDLITINDVELFPFRPDQPSPW